MVKVTKGVLVAARGKHRTQQAKSGRPSIMSVLFERSLARILLHVARVRKSYRCTEL